MRLYILWAELDVRNLHVSEEQRVCVVETSDTEVELGLLQVEGQLRLFEESLSRGEIQFVDILLLREVRVPREFVGLLLALGNWCEATSAANAVLVKAVGDFDFLE